MAILEIFANRVRGADSHISIQASRMSLVVMCIPTNFRDALGYQIPNATCQNGGTCTAPNVCVVGKAAVLIRIGRHPTLYR